MKCLPLVLSLIILVFVYSCEKEKPESEDIEFNGEVQPSYNVFTLRVNVENNATIVTKENYLKCTVNVEGNGIFPDYSGNAQIKGRGNSSWLWYDKKPYRLKLNNSSSILGLKSNRDWVLLANYRDPTKLMNTFSFEVSGWLGIPFQNHTRYVEVYLNGSYNGLYQLTEQIEQGKNRVNIDATSGILLSLDADDGPDLSPDATNNFWSQIFQLPVSVKYPSAPTATELAIIKTDFSVLEQAINTFDYNKVDSLLDIPSFINTLLLQELVYNVEIDAPRSIFLFKDIGGKYIFGPSWDFDAGFDFDWSTMYTGHNYFNAQELVFGTNPVKHTNGYMVNNFFTQMFQNRQFVTQLKTRWNEVKDSVVTHSWNIMEKYTTNINEALYRDAAKWPIDKNYSTETNRMKNWLLNRVSYLNTVINNYPEGNGNTEFQDCGSIDLNISLSYKLGYTQTSTINIDQTTLYSKLKVTTEQFSLGETSIVPLNTDGTVGENNTNGTFGAWFNNQNNPDSWATGHVYIEIFQNLFSWNCGLRAETGYCKIGDTHLVRMQYQFTEGNITKTVTVSINVTVVE